MQATASIISICGGLNMDLVYECDRMPELTESLDATSLEYYTGGKGANTAIATYRASHVRSPSADPLFSPSQQRGARRRGSLASTSNSTAATSSSSSSAAAVAAAAANGGNTSGRSDVRSDVRSGAGTGDGRGEEVRVFMNGAVGRDTFGEQLRTKLDEHGIDVTGLQTVERERTGTCTVFVEKEHGDSRNIGYQGANLHWKPTSRDSVACLANGTLPNLLIMHLGIDQDLVEETLQLASREGVHTLLNPSPARFVVSSTYRGLTHLVFNETECQLLWGRGKLEPSSEATWSRAVKQFVEYGVQNVVLTLGSKGAYYGTHEGECGLVPAEEGIVVMDPTGAGDTFVGVYAVEYIRQKAAGRWDVAAAIQRASKAASRTVERLGAQEAIPWSDEIDGIDETTRSGSVIMLDSGA